ncbi:MAG: chorismate-binding protein [Flavobacteriales bacterium]|nr:chorismate-binding protein [Flavobacteriales bacterium]
MSKNTIYYRLPGENHIHFAEAPLQQYDPQKVNDHFLLIPFLFPIDTAYMLDLEKSKELKSQEILEWELNHTYLVQNNIQKKPLFQELVKSAIQQINATKCQKIVLSRTIQEPFQIKNALTLFVDLCNVYPNAFIHFLQSPELGTWIGASPEQFLKKKGSDCLTVSLAGTRDAGSESDWDKKESQEQEIVTKYIIQQLDKAKASDINVHSRETFKIGLIEHIKNTIHFQHNADLHSLILTLHPTPAVCGFPKDKARSFIMANEGYDRSLYTGIIGPIKANKEADLYVNLRCMQVFQDEALLYLGAGITAESDPESEFQETENKSKVLMSVIQKIGN